MVKMQADETIMHETNSDEGENTEDEEEELMGGVGIQVR